MSGVVCNVRLIATPEEHPKMTEKGTLTSILDNGAFLLYVSTNPPPGEPIVLGVRKGEKVTLMIGAPSPHGTRIISGHSKTKHGSTDLKGFMSSAGRLSIYKVGCVVKRLHAWE